MDFTIRAMDTATAAAIRVDIASGRRPGRRVVVDESGAPCRHCLQAAAAGDELLLFCYQPFDGESPYAVPSPVYVHAEVCEPYAEPDHIPAFVRDGLRAVRSYDANHDLLDGDVVPGAEIEDSISRLFADERSEYLHVYSATAGCFTCRVDRAAA